MATGIAIMGFGGGALIASPWSAQMLESFGSDSSGIALAFLVHGLTYAVFMTLGVLLVRVPPDGWRPAGGSRRGAERRWSARPGLRAQRHAHPAVLVPVGRALHERDRGHRHPGEGRAHDHGLLRGHLHPGLRLRRRRLRRPAVGGQHGRAGSAGRRPPTSSAARTSTGSTWAWAR